jgi:2'-5' RNA ligase
VRVMSQLGDEWPVPHVTLKSPLGLGDDLAWLAPAREAVRGVGALHVRLGPVRSFDTRVLYLAVTCKGIEQLHERLLAACLSSDVREEDRPYVAHLTLSRSHADDVARVQRWLGDREGEDPFEVRELTIFHRAPTTHYSAWSHLPLCAR